jgi:hypothetical protein
MWFHVSLDQKQRRKYDIITDKHMNVDIYFSNCIPDALHNTENFKRPHKISQLPWDKDHMEPFIKPQCLPERW